MRAHARERALGIIQLVCACLAWGLAGPAFKRVDVNFMIRLVWRGQCSMAFIAIPFALVLIFVKSTRAPWSKSTWTGIAAVGVSMYLMFVGWNYGVSETAFSHASLLSQTHPAWLLVIATVRAWWSRRRTTKAVQRRPFPSWPEWVCVGVAAVGVVVTSTAPSTADLKSPPTVHGDLMSLGSGLASAFYVLSMTGWFGTNGSGIPNAPGIFVQATGTTLMTVLGMLTLACVPGTVWRSKRSPYDDGIFDWVSSYYLWPYIIGMGSLAIIGHVFMTEAFKHLPLIVVAVSLTLTPVLQTTFCYVLIGDDAPGLQTIIGGVIIISGIGLTMVFEERRRRREKAENALSDEAIVDEDGKGVVGEAKPGKDAVA